MNKKDQKLFEEFLAFKEFKEQQKDETTKKPKKIKRSKYTKRSDGRYKTSITVGKNSETGKPNVVYVYGKSIDELEANKAIVKADYLKGRIVNTKKIIFKDYANKWLTGKKKRVAHKTWEMYDSALRLYVGSINQLPIRSITRVDIQDIIDMYIDMPRTCRKIAVTLNQIFEQAIIDDIIYKNPLKGVILPEYKAKTKRALTEDEDKLCEVTEFTDREKAYIVLIKWCGLRKEEALGLDKSKFDFVNNTVTINQALIFIHNQPVIKDTKSNAGERVIPLVSSAATFLRYYISNLSDKWLFTCIKHSGLITEQSFNQMWKSIIKKINIKANELGYKEVKGLTSHIFRHNFATLLFQSEVPVKEIQYLLGHSSINVTMDIYTHIDVTKLQATNILENIEKGHFGVKEKSKTLIKA